MTEESPGLKRWMRRFGIRWGLVGAGILTVLVVLLPGGSTIASAPILEKGSAMFPTVTGRNLDRKEITFPGDFQAELNLVFIAFQQWQQELINTWIPYAQQLEKDRMDLLYYELPVIQELNWFSRTFINEGMRMGIPDAKARERTITLYLEKGIFRSELDLPDEGEIYILLIDSSGQVLWREHGEFTAKKADSLQAFLGRKIP